MSTPAIIILQLKGEKTIKASKRLFPSPIGRTNYHSEPFFKEYEDPRFPRFTTKGKKFVAIYHHWDGHQDTLGKELVEKYDTYKKVKNLCALGSVSTIIREIIPYGNLNNPYRKELWEDGLDKPFFADSLDEAIFNCPLGGNYYYFFDGETWARFSVNFKNKSYRKCKIRF